MDWLLGVIVAIAVVALVLLVAQTVRRVTVFEYERGLKYVNGQFRGLLHPGQYWYMPLRTMVTKVDVRPRWMAVSGQEVLSADGVSMKVSLAANYSIEDAAIAVNEVENFEAGLYTELQLAAREIIGQVEIDALLAKRDDLAAALFELTQGKAHAIGLNLISVNIKDLMFPGKLKEMFAQVVAARKEGLAALERARGEQAALRNLANAAELFERHPQLMHLRLLQVLGESTGNQVALELASPPPPPPPRPASENSQGPALRPAAKKKAQAKRKPPAKKAPASKKKPAAKKRGSRA